MQKNILKPKTKKIQFSLQAAEAQKVSLVGDFNNWNPDADSMQKMELVNGQKQKYFRREI